MFEIDKKKFGVFLASLRKEKGLTQKQMAEQLFISDKAISKWETGVSIPDTALLIPLADLLGVTVTELLLCEKLVQSNAMDAGQVETIVKTAIQYPSEDNTRLYQTKGKWGLFYGLSLLLCGIGIYLNYLQGEIVSSLWTFAVLGIVFGAYFCLFARVRLPAFYDENRISTLQDGIVRMHMPGMVFNNQNWQHILKVGRIFWLLTTALYPYIMLLYNLWFAEYKNFLEITLTLLLLGTLFVPMYLVGRKYQ